VKWVKLTNIFKVYIDIGYIFYLFIVFLINDFIQKLFPNIRCRNLIFFCYSSMRCFSAIFYLSY